MYVHLFSDDPKEQVLTVYASREDALKRKQDMSEEMRNSVLQEKNGYLTTIEEIRPFLNICSLGGAVMVSPEALELVLRYAKKTDDLDLIRVIDGCYKTFKEMRSQG